MNLVNFKPVQIDENFLQDREAVTYCCTHVGKLRLSEHPQPENNFLSQLSELSHFLD